MNTGCRWSLSSIIGLHFPTNTYSRIMGDNSVSSEDPPEVQDVLDALDDPACRAILRETIEPMTANELLDACDIPKSTLYRKLELLSSASLVREQETINPGGGRVTYYERSFEDVTISMDDTGAFSVSVDRPPQSTDERLADIWSMMGDEV
ncbi:MAG: DNA-binding transcriptional ArsR family regulator [Natronomonas sp.]|jgi:DNA-binding transcriptional ArsR family regulator